MEAGISGKTRNAGSEPDVLELLLNSAPAKLPEKEYKVKRLSKEYGGDVVFKLRALTFSRLSEIRRMESDEFAVHVALAGVASPDLKHRALLDKYDAATPAELLNKMLLSGEIDEIADKIERLSGYRQSMLEEVKKNSTRATSSE